MDYFGNYLSLGVAIDDKYSIILVYQPPLFRRDEHVKILKC